MKQLTNKQSFRKGMMTHDPFKMTVGEERLWQIACSGRARECIFAASQALVYEWNGRMVAEYPGKILDIIQ